MFDFDDFKRDVLAKIDEYAKELKIRGKLDATARSIKEEGEDLIAGWKNAFPTRTNEIASIVASKLADVFGKDEK